MKPYILLLQIDTLADRNGTQRRTKVSPQCVHCTYCGIPKGTSHDEAASNSDKIKPVALAVIELHLSEGIKQASRQAGRQVVSQ